MVSSALAMAETLPVQMSRADLSRFTNVHDLGKAQASALQECIVRRLVFDIGSSATKAGAADVDICNKRFVRSYYNFLQVPYSKATLKNSPKTFDPRIFQDGVDAVNILKENVLSNFAVSRPTEMCAFATEAFRVASNGAEAAAYITKHTGLPLRIISQHEEGVLAFNTARIREAMDDPHRTIIWDIGGASTQLSTMHKDGTVSVAGAHVAGQIFFDAVMREIKHGGHSPYPLSAEDLKKIHQLAKQMLQFQNPRPIHHKVQQGSKVLGVAPTHGNAMSFARILLGVQGNVFTYEHIDAILKKLTGLTEEEILQYVPDPGNAEFVHHLVTNLVLVSTIMEYYQVFQVTTVDHRSVDGVLTVGCDFQIANFSLKKG